MKGALLSALLMMSVAMAQEPSPGWRPAAHNGSAAQALSGQRAKPKLLALLFRADWCPSCKVLEPEYDPLAKSLSNEPILFVRLDFTNDKTTAQAKSLAARLGVGATFPPVRRKYRLCAARYTINETASGGHHNCRNP